MTTTKGVGRMADVRDNSPNTARRWTASLDGLIQAHVAMVMEAEQQAESDERARIIGIIEDMPPQFSTADLLAAIQEDGNE